MHRCSVFHSLVLLAGIIAQVQSQDTQTNQTDNTVPPACLPLCTPWATAFRACLRPDDDAAYAQCLCKQENFDSLVQCGACSIDTSNPLPSGASSDDRLDAAWLQMTYDSLKQSCKEYGHNNIASVDVKTKTYDKSRIGEGRRSQVVSILSVGCFVVLIIPALLL